MIFENAYYLFFLLLLIALVILHIVVQNWKRKATEAFAEKHLLQKIAPGITFNNQALKTILFFVGLFFIILALTNPKYGTSKEKVKSKGIDIIFAVDVSRSMLAEDIAPNRLEKSKQIATQIVNQLQGDRVGIVAYSGSAFPVMPITTDYNVAKMFIKNLDPASISEQGTSIDQAIEIATELFNKTSKSNKLIVVFSDGEDHSNQAESAAKEANSNAIKIISIGVGTEKGAPIPLKENGTITGFQRDNENNVVLTKRNQNILQSIAKITNEVYIDGNNSRSATQQVIDKVNAYQKTENSYTQMARLNSYFQWFLAIGLLVLLVDFFIFENKKNK